MFWSQEESYKRKRERERESPKCGVSYGDVNKFYVFYCCYLLGKERARRRLSLRKYTRACQRFSGALQASFFRKKGVAVDIHTIRW